MKPSRRRHLFEKLSAQNLQQTASPMVKIKLFSLAFKDLFVISVSQPSLYIHCAPAELQCAEWHYSIFSNRSFTLPPLGPCPCGEEALGPQLWSECCSEPVPILTSAKVEKSPGDKNQCYVVLGPPAFFLCDF